MLYCCCMLSTVQALFIGHDADVILGCDVEQETEAQVG